MPDNQPWCLRFPFNDEKDYPALKAYLRDIRYSENYEAVRQKENEGDGDFFMRGTLGYAPLNDLMLIYMGVQRFSFEWVDNRGKIMELLEILLEKKLDLCRIACGAPYLAVNIGGNVTAEVVSPRMFKEFYVPFYNDLADRLHGAEKLAGVHFDGITGPYAEDIRSSGIDYIEALTPPPTCDVSVAEAHRLWPDKILWINFPSSIHVAPEETLRRVTRRLLDEARPHKRFLMGITDDVPPDRWPVNFRIILDEVNRFRR